MLWAVRALGLFAPFKEPHKTGKNPQGNPSKTYQKPFREAYNDVGALNNYSRVSGSVLPL